MNERRGEKIGWTWGWIGGFLWIAIVGLVFLAQGRAVAGITGLLLFIVAVWATHRFAPWRHPATPYWRLMALQYALFLLSAAWAIWAFGGWGARWLDGWMLLWFGPLFLPVFLHGRRTWADGEPGARRGD
jgi:hypothetical protein